MNPSPMTVAAGVEHYLDWLRRRGRAANTIKAYRVDLTQFVEFVARLGHGDLVALISARHVSRWLDDLSARGCSNRSAARKLSVLRNFVRHAMREGWLAHDPTADEKVSFRTVRVIAPEMAELLGMVKAIPDSGRQNKRDRAALRLALDCGLRISEVANIDLPGADSQSTVDLGRQLVHVVGKGGDIETVGFDDTTRRVLEEWLKSRWTMAKPDELALFVNTSGRRLSRQGLHEMVKRRGAAVGLGKMHWHLMRHRRVAQVIEKTDMKLAQQFARHSSIATTSHYGQHTDSVARELIREHAPLEQGRAAA